MYKFHWAAHLDQMLKTSPPKKLVKKSIIYMHIGFF